ncbi:hypothetical protein HG536_0A07500 [Torulaspora globosa]|uniref:Mitochondrial adapter protein MCP1 transmembrane domain-containing protein n=1 Tax=Torulaspora globosa TaxID=48254 RepID=A0A7G3ZBP9_9SACH|nr:uncharacterized protein HG536_0A07500 [Torulaspora globosa]QLL30935.1 hypothetical protein HG536_0A07500 [Torulaspora globosa]
MSSPRHDPISLKEIPPEPIEDGKAPEIRKEPKKLFGIPIYPVSNRSVVLGLRRVQKYSTIPIALYFPLHAVNTLVVPALSPGSLPDDVLMMVRELLPSFTTKLLVASIALHLGSGAVLRIWQTWKQYVGSGKKGHRRHHRKEKQLRVTDAAERDSQRLIGLTGGLSGYFVGFNRRFSTSPQVLSGYILLPALGYHMAIMKFIPDSPGFYVDVDFSFVKWILQNDDWRIKWLAGIIPLSLLIYSGTYHIVAGACQYLQIRSLQARRQWSNVLFALTLSGLVAVYRLSKWSPTLAGSTQYRKIFEKIHLL